MMMRTTCKKTALLALLGASACAAVAARERARRHGRRRQRAGRSGPAPRAGVHKVALATWFGPGFYGQTTACGQTLTPAVVGVANRTLPCGTLVKVSYRGRR